MTAAQTGEQGAGSGWANARELHQTFATRVVTGRWGDSAVVLGDQDINPIGVRQETADALVGVTRWTLQIRADLAAQASHLLRKNDAKF